MHQRHTPNTNHTVHMAMLMLCATVISVRAFTTTSPSLPLPSLLVPQMQMQMHREQQHQHQHNAKVTTRNGHRFGVRSSNNNNSRKSNSNSNSALQVGVDMIDMDVVSSASESIASTDLMTNPLSLTTLTSAINSFFDTQPYLASFLTCSVKASAADIIAQRQDLELNDDEFEGEGGEGTTTTTTATTTSTTPMMSTTSIQDQQDQSKVITIGNDVDVTRNLGFLLYGGLYTGIAQNFLYTVLFPNWFGTEKTFTTIVKQVMADNFFFGPFFCLPIAYAFKGCFQQKQQEEQEQQQQQQLQKGELSPTTSSSSSTIGSLRIGLEKYLEDVFERDLLKTYWTIWIPVQFLTFSIIPTHFRVVFVALVSFFWFFLLSTISAAEGTNNNNNKETSN